ncbi:MAG: hypothetical protein JHD33_01835 [Chthoniobacterales bacterium]|nr:hypothetical protein [Chthoniobacterales bacterium]
MSLPFIAAALGWAVVLWRACAVVLGIWLLWEAIRAAVGVMLVPRPGYTALALFAGKITKSLFAAAARRSRDYFALDRVLAAQGPATVLFFLAIFLTIFVAAFALIFYGIGGTDFTGAVARAGSAMTTLGFESVNLPVSRFVMFSAAFMGSTIIAMFIGFLLTLYAAYTAREAGVSELSLLTGEPAWGPEMLVRSRRVGDVPTASAVAKWISWMCAMRVNQYIYPLLNHFRSPIPNRHWVTSLLALLDASAIRIASVDEPTEPLLVRFLAEGASTMHMLRHSELARTARRDERDDVTAWRFESDILAADTTPTGDPCVTRAEWDAAMKFLAGNGVPLKADREAAWRTFARIRAHYAPPACFLAETLFAAPAPWSGPRSPMRHFQFKTTWPQLAAEAGVGLG